MKNVDRFDDQAWKKFLTFLLPNEESMALHEVEAELQHLGMDTRAGFAKVQRGLQKMAATREARAALEAAREQRPSMLAKLRDKASQVGALTKDELRRIIADRFSGTAQAAFFRKLDAVASEDDLKSLLDDMSKLDALTEESDDAEP
ncbi:MAG: hypothetical protein WC869_02365 [Phycisphaerae bacterium]|jgi:hypothetical protein